MSRRPTLIAPIPEIRGDVPEMKPGSFVWESDRAPTPGPWRACHDGDCPCGFIWSGDGNIHVATVHDEHALGQDWYGADCAVKADTRKANARLIVRAVNCHADLVAALEALVADVLEYERINNLAPNPGRRDCWDSVTAARAALAKAGETE